MASLQHKVFRNVRSSHCLSGLISLNLGLFPTSVSVNGSLFRSFAGWVFFGISKTIICLYLPKRFLKFFTNCQKLSCRSVSARKLACVTGRIVSNFLIIGDVCKLVTKALHRLIECRSGWDAQVVLDSDALIELKFWREHLQTLNCRTIWRQHTLPSRVVYSDASAVGCAAFISMNGRPVSHKNWDAIEIKQSSTWRELMCVKHALQSFVHLLKGGLVKWYTDNQGVAAIVKAGSTKVHLHKLAMEIFLLSKEYDVSIDIEWIPRSENEVADYLSKIVDFDDWCVRDSYFRAVDSVWGPFTVDCFANSVNAKVSRSSIPCFFSQGVWV